MIRTQRAALAQSRLFLGTNAKRLSGTIMLNQKITPESDSNPLNQTPAAALIEAISGSDAKHQTPGFTRR
jgi:hypothetical protein